MIVLVKNNKIVSSISGSKEYEQKILTKYSNAILVDNFTFTEDLDLYEYVDGEFKLINGWEKIKEKRDKQKQLKNLIKMKQNILKNFFNQVKNHIENHYPEIKQRSDINDKEFWGAWLITHFPDTYNLVNLYQKFFKSASNIIEGVTDIETELNNLKEITTFDSNEIKAKYSIAIEQLLKVAIRQGFVNACKFEFNTKKDIISNVDNIKDLGKVKLELPEYPLKGI